MIAVHATVCVRYEGEGSPAEAWFEGQTLVAHDSPVQLAGDSGSVWISQERGLACVLGYAAAREGRMSIGFPLVWLSQVFGVTVPPLGECGVSRGCRLDMPQLAWVGSLDDDTLRKVRRRVQTARSVSVGKLPPANEGPGGRYSRVFTQVAEYWYYSPQTAASLSSASTVRVALVVHKGWNTQDPSAEESSIEAALGMPQRLNPTIVDPSAVALPSPDTGKSWWSWPPPRD